MLSTAHLKTTLKVLALCLALAGFNAPSLGAIESGCENKGGVNGCSASSKAFTTFSPGEGCSGDCCAEGGSTGPCCGADNNSNPYQSDIKHESARPRQTELEPFLSPVTAMAAFGHEDFTSSPGARYTLPDHGQPPLFIAFQSFLC